jgi:hypothetical protein
MDDDIKTSFITNMLLYYELPYYSGVQAILS